MHPQFEIIYNGTYFLEKRLFANRKWSSKLSLISYFRFFAKTTSFKKWYDIAWVISEKHYRLVCG
jgi:hypothetical protein